MSWRFWRTRKYKNSQTAVTDKVAETCPDNLREITAALNGGKCSKNLGRIIGVPIPSTF